MFSLIRRKQRPLVPPLGNDLLTAKPQRDVFFAGLNYFDNTPLLFDRSESVHSIYYGGTGSGKSASMAFALEQAIHAGDNALVVDLKGLDYMLYAAMCSAAARCGIDPPIYLTSRFRMPTYLCPVMRYDWWKHGLAAHEKADALVAALGLDDALSHSWWADAAEELYAFIAEQVDPDEIDDFVKFFDMLELRKNDLPKALRNDTIHAIIKAKRLARVTMFNPPADCHPAALEHACNLQDLLRSDKQRLVFVSLDSVRTEKTASAIARFLGRALLLAADDLADQRSARLQVVFDEAQRALGPGFMDLVLTLSRSAGISFTAGFQDISVLRHRGIDYTALFDENTDLQFALLHESTARLRVRDVIASIHSAAAGKAGNQDSTLLWVPFDVGRIRWAAAVADGVSCSFYAKCGSRLACHAALAVLLGLQERGDKVLRPLPSCVKMFQRIGRRIAECPEAFRPAGCSQSIWRRVVRDGTLFQTTLLVVWQEGRRLHVDGIGDGGFILVYRPDAHPMTFFPSSSGPVNCLGPKTLLDDRDYGHEFSQWNTLAAFTDGVSDAISHNLDASLDRLHVAAADPQTNPAEVLIRFLDQQSPELIDDNMSALTVVRGEQP